MGKRKLREAENDGLRVEAFEWANKQNQLLEKSRKLNESAIRKDKYSTIILGMSIALLLFMIYEAVNIISILKMVQ